ncbi:MAG: radical SAM protein [Syntrophales bacterium]|nr:radical SAM protein [Syntrophales bacterium]MDY0045093.1 radical SAM protein [Syntrophales bacterium]
MYKEKKLRQHVSDAMSLLAPCRLCPHKCMADRLSGEKGICQTGRYSKVASYAAHFGEEAPLVGRFGSGTIFFSSCNLFCSFCQNYEISHFKTGSETKPDELADIMLKLEKIGCHNINFVTPTHVIPQILEALLIAAEKGLAIPLVYNTGGYDSVETLKIIENIFDIYMPDFKFRDSEWARRYCCASDYPSRTMEAIEEMYRQVGDLSVDTTGIALRGLIVRHLVLPHGIAGTEEVMKFLAERISRSTYVNIMNQYRPCFEARNDPFLNRRITEDEYRRALNAAVSAGLIRLDSQMRYPAL